MNGENMWRAEKEHFFLRNRGSEKWEREAKEVVIVCIAGVTVWGQGKDYARRQWMKCLGDLVQSIV